MGGTISYKGRALLNCGSRKGNVDSDQFELTDREKELVRSTWIRLVERSDEVSVDIFLRIFDKIPQAKQFFPFKNAVGEALLKHPYFKGHAMRFFNAVRMTVINLDAWEIVLIPNLIKLGQQHADIQGFQHDYFEVFRKAMNEVFSKYLGRAYTSETRAAWNKIFALITAKVEEGYVEGQQIKRRRESEQFKSSHDEVNHSANAPPKMCPLAEHGEMTSSSDPVPDPGVSVPDKNCYHDNEREARSEQPKCPINHVTSADGMKTNERPPCNDDDVTSAGGRNNAKTTSLHINNNGIVDRLGTEPPNGENRQLSDLGNCV